MNHFAQEGRNKATARRCIAAILAREILIQADPKDFLIASEHQLCRRFAVSRVTIRLALGDLEHRGLVYRKHGKGTFAYGSSSQVHPSLGIVIRSPDAFMYAPFVEFIRGAQTAMMSFNSSVVLIGTSPLDWRTEMTSALGAVIVIHGDLTADELHSLKNRKLPSICIPESQLTVGDCDGFALGLCTAKALNHAAITGEPVGGRVGRELPPPLLI